MTPSLSIAVPAYNQGRFLRSTLESLLRQSVPADEIVVSDNHSTDETAAVLAEFADRVRVVRPPRHLPMTAHWNFLAGQLHGEWFSIVASDDRATEAFVEVMHRGIARRPDAVLVRAGYEILDPGGNVTDRSYLLSVKGVTGSPDNFLEQLTGPKVCFASFALRTAAWEEAGGFPEECSIYGDWGMWLRASAVGPFVYEHAVAGQYRSGDEGKSRARVLRGLQDDAHIQTRLIPELAARVGIAGDRRIHAASRTRCLRSMRAAGALLDPADRATATCILEPWAASAGCERELHRFAAGARYRSAPFLAGPRRVLRGVVQTLRR